jgi:hypothetical protein
MAGEIEAAAAVATAELARMTADFKASAGSRVDRLSEELASLDRDPHFLNQEISGNSGAAMRRAALKSQLAAAKAEAEGKHLDVDPVASIMNGVVPPEEINTSPGNRVRAVDAIAAVNDMRERGIPDQMTRELLQDKKPTLEQHLIAKRMQAVRMADPEWMKRLIAHDEEAEMEFLDFSWGVGCYEPPA